jgi:serine/threonine protein kinase
VTGDFTAPSPLAPGYRLDRYELLCPIAQGGMASVWVARLRAKHGFEKLVAVKTMLPQLAQDVRFQQMFLDEARIAAKIDHVNVAHVLDLGDEHGVLYLVMEWVEGDSLSKLHRAVKASGAVIPLGIALRIVADSCAGLHAAHELRDAQGARLGVVHRDVSPQNLLISAAGIVKVIDFGIAKARDRVAGETSTGSLKGKIQYMAPEQAVGAPIDRRADVWSAGAVLYTLLSGEPPYDGNNQYATLHQIASGERPPPLPAGTPAAVVAIVDKALAFEPHDRFETVAAMQQAIEVAMVETQVSASHKDVAEFASPYMAGRDEARRKSIDLALRAAADREEMERVLVPLPNDSDTSRALPRPTDSTSIRRALPTVPDVMAEAPGTLSSPTLSAASFHMREAPRASQRKVALAVIGVAVAIVVFALGRFTTAPGDPTPTTSAATHGPPVTRPAPPPPAPVTPPPPAAPAPATGPVGALPAASADPPRRAPPRRAAPVATFPPRVAPRPAPTPKPGAIDDGF